MLFPGLSFQHIDSIWRERDVTVPTVLWNHRWEHDKSVTEFIDTTGRLQKSNVDFRLILLGQTHDNLAGVRQSIDQLFGKELVHCGFAETKNSYASLLHQADIVVSTAMHEFFGVAVIEAIRAGCVPVLPDRLSYRELYPGSYLYHEGGFEGMLLSRIKERNRLNKVEACDLTDRFSWQSLASSYAEWLAY